MKLTPTDISKHQYLQKNYYDGLPIKMFRASFFDFYKALSNHFILNLHGTVLRVKSIQPCTDILK